MLLLAFAPLITLFLLLTYYSESLTVCSFGESRERKSPPSSKLSNSSRSRSYLESYLELFFSRKIPPEYLSLILVEQKSREHLKIHSSCEAWHAAVVPTWHPWDLLSLLSIPTLSPTYTDCTAKPKPEVGFSTLPAISDIHFSKFLRCWWDCWESSRI